MRFALSGVLIPVLICSYSCQKKSEYQFSSSVKFEQGKFEDVLVAAVQQDKLVMVDFWSAG
jgi:hypothetical protein